MRVIAALSPLLDVAFFFDPNGLLIPLTVANRLVTMKKFFLSLGNCHGSLLPNNLTCILIFPDSNKDWLP